MSVATGEIIHHELLVRMISPSGEMIAPGSFLPVAEAHGMIQEIDRRVFEMAMVYAAAGHRVGVNMSADSLSEPGLFRYVEEQLTIKGVDPRLVVFEVTETALIHNERADHSAQRARDAQARAQDAIERAGNKTLNHG